MEKTQYSQLELFTEKQNLPVQKRSLHASLLHFIKAYEKVTLVLICAMVVAIGAFSLGVEKGKALAPTAMRSAIVPQAEMPPAATAQKVQNLPAQVPEAALQASARAPLPVPTTISEQSNPPVIGAFTIQVASYQNKDSAQKEAEALKKNGFPVSLALSGKYTVLCIGKFNNKKSAETMLAKIKKQYQGCFIRRL
jgi:cell division septation protein DedD